MQTESTGVIQAEQSILGSVLIDSACHGLVFSSIRQDDFFIKGNRDIFSVARSMWERGDVVDPVTIEVELNRQKLDDEGTHGYLAKLMLVTPTAANVGKYIQIVKEAARRRAIQKYASEIASSVSDGLDSVTILSNANERLADLNNNTDSPVVSSDDSLTAWLDWVERHKADPSYSLVQTGYDSLDKQLEGGFFKTGFYVVGGRPGMGKTTTALNIAERIAKNGKNVLFLSLEMSLEQVVSKRIAILSGVGYSKLYTGRLNESDAFLVEQTFERIRNAKYGIVAEGISTVNDLAMVLRMQKDIDIVFVDYMGILDPVEEDRQKPRYEQITNISKALKVLAKRFNLPIVSLCQLNRESTKTITKRPSLSDLRDTGAIEQDADGVILVHRPGYYDEEDESNDIELIVAKNRHGGTGTVVMKWEPESGIVFEEEMQSDLIPQKKNKSAPFVEVVSDPNDLPF